MIGTIVIFVGVDALNNFDGGYRTVVGANATAGIFVTFPQPYLTTIGGFADQVRATFSIIVFSGH